MASQWQCAVCGTDLEWARPSGVCSQACLDQAQGFTQASEERVHCDQCQMLAINGVACHETGCPRAWEGQERICHWCGRHFLPDRVGQHCCDDECYESMYR